MAIRVGHVKTKQHRVASTKRCPSCQGAGSVDDLRDGQRALQDVMSQQRLKALAKARRVKARLAKRGRK